MNGQQKEIVIPNEAALQLHLQIETNLRLAAASLLNVCRGLKKMRDEKLYISLGYEKFEDYTQRALGVKERQAYNYIAAYEQLGEQFMEENAGLGITKLSALIAVPPTERGALVENNDLAQMSAAEVKRLAEENSQRGEQLGLLQQELSAEREKAAESSEKQKTEIEELNRRIKELEGRPTPVAVEEPSEEMIAKLKAEAEQSAKKSFAEEKAKLNERLKNAESAAKEKAEKELKEYRAQLQAANTELQQAAENAEELKRRLKVADNPNILKFSISFENVQREGLKLFEVINEIGKSDSETAEKFKSVLLKYFDSCKEKCK